MYHYPATIRPAVSAETIGKVTRMFNGKIEDIIAELFQNARRAGAGSIEVSVDDSRSPAWVTIRDDGQGIAHPAHFVTLGQSGWDRQVCETEDPAGMGVFSLAGTSLIVTSRPAGASMGWSATVAPEAWTGAMDIAVSAAEHPVGTTIAFELTKVWLIDLCSAVDRQARFLPIPVTLAGIERRREDWFKDAVHRASWNGCTIGVVMDRPRAEPAINFHGLTVNVNVASVDEVRGRTFTAIVDMGPSNDIQLVLPARKEVVQNDAWSALREAAERVIYEAIATLPSHRLSFAHWRRASDLGVLLSEAKAELTHWRPRLADGNANGIWYREPQAAEDAVLMPDLEPMTANPFARALRGHPLVQRLADQEKRYIGYSWYDALPLIGDVTFFVTGAGGAFSIVDGQADPQQQEHVLAETIALAFMLRHDNCPIPYQVPADVALIGDQDNWSWLDDTTIVWRDCKELSPSDMADMLEKAFFSAGEDHGDDSFETQQERFEEGAIDLALELMRGADEALCEQFSRALHSLAGMIPAGKQIEAIVTREGPVLRLLDGAGVTA